MAWSRVAVGLVDVGEAVVLVEELEELAELEELEALFCARLTAAQRMTENHNVVRIMSRVTCCHSLKLYQLERVRRTEADHTIEYNRVLARNKVRSRSRL